MQSMKYAKAVIELGRTARAQNNLMVKTPLKSLLIVNENESVLKGAIELKSYILEELNVMEICTDQDDKKYIDF